MASPGRLLFCLLVLAAFWAGGVYATLRLQPGARGVRGTDAADRAFMGQRLSSAALGVHDALLPLASALPTPEPGDWLAEHSEGGQTFSQFIRSDPPRPRGARRYLYVAPLGSFTEAEASLLGDVCEYLERYFGIPVKRMDGVPLLVLGGGEHALPRSVVREAGRGFGPQVRSEWVLQRVLRPLMPGDAALLIGFTARDLWPGRGWNFVFGQADLKRRVGVWSLARLGRSDGDEEARRVLLRRTLKVATHETGHMLGMRHCVAYACNMNGSNHLAESDRQPMHLCPTCTAKLVWAVDVNLANRGRALDLWARGRGLPEDAHAAWRTATGRSAMLPR